VLLLFYIIFGHTKLNIILHKGFLGAPESIIYMQKALLQANSFDTWAVCSEPLTTYFVLCMCDRAAILYGFPCGDADAVAKVLGKADSP